MTPEQMEQFLLRRMPEHCVGVDGLSTPCGFALRFAQNVVLDVARGAVTLEQAIGDVDSKTEALTCHGSCRELGAAAAVGVRLRPTAGNGEQFLQSF